MIETFFIVLQIITLVLTFSSPIILASFEIIKRVEKSTCCGNSSIEMRHINELKHYQSNHSMKIEEIIKKIENIQ